MNEQLQDIPLITIDGKEVSLKDYAGKVILIVNVASKCGLTPQYSSLKTHQKLWSRCPNRDNCQSNNKGRNTKLVGKRNSTSNQQLTTNN